jgi:hypothetical protein
MFYSLFEFIFFLPCFRWEPQVFPLLVPCHARLLANRQVYARLVLHFSTPTIASSTTTTEATTALVSQVTPPQVGSDISARPVAQVGSEDAAVSVAKADGRWVPRVARVALPASPPTIASLPRWEPAF